jgi:hypothetical protein
MIRCLQQRCISDEASLLLGLANSQIRCVVDSEEIPLTTMSEPCETPEKADSESRSSTPRASSIISLDFDESSKSERHSRARSSR